MTYFHYTHLPHAREIIESGYIDTTDSVTDMWKPHRHPDVVWLLDVGDAHEHSHGLTSPLFHTTEEASKQRMRFEVDVPAIKWIGSKWYKKTDPTWRAIMIEAGGGIEAAEHWYVWPKPIPMQKWVSVVDTLTGEKLMGEGGKIHER